MKFYNYLNESNFKIGDYIKQGGSDFVTYGQLVDEQKKGYKIEQISKLIFI
ncbi:MAG: hypothetical protein ACOCRX_03860 [Candidatus Woesearchaeota archaeon]